MKPEVRGLAPEIVHRETFWHSRPAQTVLEILGTNETGLSTTEAAGRMSTHGPNILPRKPPPPLWKVVLRQFKSPLIYVLAAAAAASAALGDLQDAGFIAVVLIVNAAIGTIQEWRAEKSSQALQRLLRVRATVLRDGELIDLDAESLVPGDVVRIESGDRVPADLRLLETTGLRTDESLLTGESLAVTKDAGWNGEEKAPVADRLNMAHAGTVVQNGRGLGVAASTGRNTAIGKLAEHIVFAPEPVPPLMLRMEKFSLWLTVVLVALSLLLAGAGIAQGRSLREMFFFTVALAVSAIPEGLPAALAVALSVASARMARRGVIVRRLPAVEGLGSCTLIASDKTGTLTCNELTAREILLADGTRLKATGEGYAPDGQVLRDGNPAEPDGDLAALCRVAALCNEADLHRRGENWIWRGDPTDIALLSLAHKLGWKREAALAAHPQEGAIPFEAERRYAASFHRFARRLREDGAAVEAEIRACVKGAPERVLPMCATESAGWIAGQLAAAESMAARGFRVLAFAEGPAPAGFRAGDAPPEPSGLRFLGFVGLIDPLRAGAREAVAACRTAGVTVWMVTGDHPVTALALSRELGLAEKPEEVVTGAALAEMTPEGIRESIRQAKVFARVAPEQKLQLVQAAKEAGHFVAVTGDGVNDAPALRAAHIGVAMGKGGTEVAREAAALVISDDNFATVVGGIEEGRAAYKNIRNVICLVVSTGAAEVVICGLSVLAGLPLALTAVQLLWLNLVTNGIQDVALAFEPGTGNELREKPRPPREPIFNRLMVEKVLLSATVMGVLGFGLFRWLLESGWGEDEARNVLLLFMVLFENVYIGNCRSETVFAFKLSPLKSPILLIGTVAAFSIHLAMMYLPAGQKLLGTAPVDLKTWLLLVPMALTLFAVMEIHKWLWRRFRI